jgi:hypothetical protein
MGKSTINGHFQYVSIAMLNYQRVSKTALIHYHGVLCLTSAQTANRATSSRRLGCPQAPESAGPGIHQSHRANARSSGRNTLPLRACPKMRDTLRIPPVSSNVAGNTRFMAGKIIYKWGVHRDRKWCPSQWDFRLQDLWCADPLGNIVTAAQFKFN